MNITIQDIDDLKNHLAESISRDVQIRIDPLVSKIEGVVAKVGGFEATQNEHGNEIRNLKANQAKALVGFAVLCTGVSLLFNQAKSWLLSHVHLNG